MSERLESLIAPEQIRDRVGELARQIEEDHRGAPLTLVIVLKGAAVFAADLMRQISIPFVVDFIGASSYRDRTYSSGTILIGDRSGLDIRDRHVVVVEDIVDTGLTIRAILTELRALGPASLEVCALLRKQVPGARPVEIRYEGFEVPDVFVVGYGMDYAERHRNLPGVCALILSEPNR
ncbi:MAG TPA: hypoxanthine phosphoribosyltransferase [Stellaceae bacterium]|nr:hypoxanthine phosphoribosyltransferase [Stellaceae bacterium]